MQPEAESSLTIEKTPGALKRLRKVDLASKIEKLKDLEGRYGRVNRWLDMSEDSKNGLMLGSNTSLQLHQKYVTWGQEFFLHKN